MLAKFIITASLLLTSLVSFGQNTALTDGTNFANGIQPTANGQLFNPSAVPSGANTSIPSTVPTNLGGFSNPNTDPNILLNARANGLSNVGLQAQINCQNYVAGAAGTTAATDQQCAAVNFLSNQCMTPSTAQAGILQNTGTTGGTGTNCEGTYGQGASKFNFQISPNDYTFQGTSASSISYAVTSGQSCSTSTTIDTPAQSASDICVINNSGTEYSCSQSLTTTVTSQITAAKQTDICTAGVLIGNYCEQTTSEPSTPNYACAQGYTLNGTTCSETISSAATPIYACPIGQSLNGSTCTATSSATIASYSCPSGYTVSGSSCTQTITQAGSPNYSCPTGSTLNGSNCITPTNVSSPATLASYSCPTGYALSGSSCTQTLTQAATANYSCSSGTLSGTSCLTSSPATVASYSCPTGYTLSGTSCSETLSQAATASYSCPTGGTLTGSGSASTCTTVTTSSATPTYSCATGQALSGTQCVYLANTCTPGTLLSTSSAYQGPYLDPYVFATVTCAAGGYNITVYSSQTNSAGTPLQTYISNQFVAAVYGQTTAASLIGNPGQGCTYPIYNSVNCTGNSCVVDTYYTKQNCPGNSWNIAGTFNIPYVSSAATLSGYTCPSGTLSGSSCKTTASNAATPSYSCPSGYTLSGTLCKETLTQSASPASYSCGSGQTLSGTNCTTTSIASISSYTCPSGYTVSGSTCIQTITQAGTPNYSCPTGSTLNGSNCISPTNVSSPATLASYTCPNGYALSGSTCIQTLTQLGSPNYSCPSSYILSGTTCLQTLAASIASYSCPTGYTLNGTNCTETLTQYASISGYSCPNGGTLTGTGGGSTCATVNTTPATVTYSCIDGSAPINGTCVIKSTETAWTDSCGTYEASAGQSLLTPH